VDSNFISKKIAKQSEIVDKAEEKLKSITEDIQHSCKHLYIATHEHHGDMRICLQCGREEHAPYYHNFVFTLKPTTDRTFIPVSFNDFMSKRVQGAKIFDMLKELRR